MKRIAIHPVTLLLIACASFIASRYAAELFPGLIRTATVGPVIAAHQFKRSAGGVYEVTQANNSEKLLFQKLTLAKDTVYHISFDIPTVSATGMVVVDFYGTGYDSNDQEFHLNLSPTSAPLHVDRFFNSGLPPSDAILRVFSFDPMRFTLSNIRVEEYSSALNLAKQALDGLALLAGAVLIVLLFRTISSGSFGGLRPTDDRILEACFGWGAAIFLAAFVGLGITVRNLALNYPFVFGDEGIYVILAKHFGRSQLLNGDSLVPILPNTLYLAATNSIFRLGANYFQGARLMNAVWVCVTLLLIYAIARKFVSAPWALLAAAATGAGPVSIYAVCVMPEAMYLCGISCMLFVFVQYIESRPLLASALTGMLVGAASLVKPHALLLVPAIVIALALLKGTVREWSSWKTFMLQILAFLACTVASQAILNYVLTGHAGFSLGSTYSREVSRTTNTSPPGLLLMIFAGHCAALLSVYAAPLVVGAMTLSKRALKPAALADTVNFRALLLLVICCLGTLLITTTKYTASNAGRSFFEGSNRLHGRYYFFLLPFLLVTFFAGITRLDWNRRHVRLVFATTSGLAFVLAFLAILFVDRRYSMYSFDFPDVFWFVMGSRALLWFPLLFTCIPLLAYTTGRTHSAAWFAGGYALLSIAATVYMTQYLQEQQPTSADRASSLFRSLIPEAEWDNGLIILTESGDVEPYRLLFQMPAAYDLISYVAPSAIPADLIHEDRSWVLVTSGRPVNFNFAQAYVSGRYHLYIRRVDPPKPLSAPQPTLAPANACETDRLVGFQEREDWGVWSANEVAEILLKRPVSGHVRLHLVAYRLPKNPSDSLQVGVGDSFKTIHLGGEPQAFDLDYRLISPVAKIAFRGVTPRTPKSLGLGEDTRPLGVALIDVGCFGEP
jgi:phosphoglycerol transferase